MYSRKILIFILVSLLLTGCGSGQQAKNANPAFGQSDTEYVTEKGTLVVGITDYAPMDYREGDTWLGFDAELADAFANTLGVELELKEIDWEKKTDLLEDGTIDCIWNGMTLTEKLQESISCSEPYLSNAQVIVMQSSRIGKYQTVEDCQHLLFAAEGGSAGEMVLRSKKYRYSTFPKQKEALQSVCEMESDAAVIDIIMASYYTNSQQDFNDLDFALAFNDETICIGFRDGSDLTEKADAFLKTAYEDGTMELLAKKYGIEDALLKAAQ